MPSLRQIANLWSLRDYPRPDDPWGIDAQLDAIKSAGFDGVTGRIGSGDEKRTKDRDLVVVGFVSSGDDSEFAVLLKDQRDAGARHVNVQLADHDTPTTARFRSHDRMAH